MQPANGTRFDWGLAGLSCDDSDSSTDLDTRTATIRVQPKEIVRCMFTNEGPGTIIIEKQTDVQGDITNFNFQGGGIPGDNNATYVLSDDGTRSFTVGPGTYAASERDPGQNYRVSDIRCSDSDSTSDLETRTATIRVSAGETVRCVFENTDLRGRIVIEKQTDVQGDIKNFNFQGGGIPGDNNATYVLSDDGTRSFTVPPGTYAASEWDPVPTGDWPVSAATTRTARRTSTRARPRSASSPRRSCAACFGTRSRRGRSS